MATWKKIIVSGSQAQLAGVTGSFTGSFIGDGSQLTGVSAAGTLSSSAQIADNISGSFSAAHLNTKVPGIISGAAQLPSGTISGSAQLPSGTVSGSAQTVANLPAGTISGSAQVNADSITNFDTNVVAGLPAGTISGSVQVNADTITNFDTNVKAKMSADGVISSSAQIDGDFLNTTGDNVLSSSAQIGTDISGSLSKAALNTVSAGLVSGSAQTIAHLPSGTVSGSSQLPSGIISGAAQLPSGTVSGSAQTIANLPSGTVSGSAQVTLQDADKTGFTGVNSITTLGTVVTGNVAAILPSGTVSSSAQITAGSNTISSSAQLADDISGSFSAAHLNAKVAGVVSASAEGSAQGTIAINGVDVNVNGFQTGDSPTLTGLTLTGNLEVQGTTTTVDSTTVEFADNIIALNGTGAAKGGLAVNDANGPASGSLLWDGANNHWVAGGTGSESKIFTAGGDDSLVSGSGQVKALLPSGTVSGSAQSIANLATSGIISGAAQINATALNLNANGNQFSGSFQGDGSGLTGVTAAGTLSSSAQIATEISGALSVTALNSVSPGIISGAAQLPSGTISGSAQVNADSITNFDTNVVAGLPAGTVSGSAQTIANLPAGTVSGSAQTVANLNNQDVDLGTGDITGVSASFGFIGTAASTHTGSFSGDGSALTNITVDQNATVTASFSNAATASVTHNFDSDNIIVVAYDGDDEQFIPSTIKAVNSNTVQLHFSPNATGRAIVARGGHIVSGSIPFGNITALPSLVSSSAQIATNISGALSTTAIAALGGGIISSSTQIDTDLFDIDGLVSGAAQITPLLPAGTVSGSAQSVANLTSQRITATDFTGSSFTGSFVGDGSGLTGVTADGTLSSSAQIADNISGSFSAAHLNAKVAGVVSGSSIASSAQGQVALTTNGVAASAVDLGLQTTDSPTFAGLTVAGDLTVTGNTIEAQVTNLNVEDKYILLNSGSTSGDSGIVFGGADGVANQGVGLFWDNGYNSNDGRLAVVNSIAAGATGDQTPAYHIVGALEGNESAAATAQMDHVGNIRVESEEIYIYV